MPTYVPPLDDMNFLLKEVFEFDRQMAERPEADAIDSDVAAEVLAEAGRFCTDIIQPLNLSGDAEGCRLENGVVTTPKGFRKAYDAFVEGGWNGLSASPEHGGQGLPVTLQVLVDEMLSSANLSFGLFPGLTRGAAEAIAHHASDELKALYLPKLVSGEWTGVMALTEASSGTDLGIMTTRAAEQDDGSYRITGNKIFISSGDHDLTANVVHLVLARLADAPKGVKGISLFLVPKFLPNEDGSPGPRNDLSVGSLEHKMGIHAQPTCVMNYDGAVGWLVGERHSGLNAMFVMMNLERLFVGIQGLGVGEVAYQNAAAYAKERLQGRSLDGTRSPVPIVEHPDVRKMLLTARAYNEGGRALAVWTALQMDKASGESGPVVDGGTTRLVGLLTPVIKAALTDFGLEAAVQSQQVFGGHGYVREWGMEQFVRDVRITQIYEGTNGVQAMDLVGRKIGMEGGRLPHRFFDLIASELAMARATSGAEAIVAPVSEALDRLRRATERLQAQTVHPAEIGAAATDYLRMFALVSFGWMWARMAAQALAAGDDARPFHHNKVAVARFFVDRVLPQTLALEASLAAGAAPLMELQDAAF